MSNTTAEAKRMPKKASVDDTPPPAQLIILLSEDQGGQTWRVVPGQQVQWQAVDNYLCKKADTDPNIFDQPVDQPWQQVGLLYVSPWFTVVGTPDQQMGVSYEEVEAAKRILTGPPPNVIIIDNSGGSGKK
jgi:hypothetical protein